MRCQATNQPESVLVESGRGEPLEQQPLDPRVLLPDHGLDHRLELVLEQRNVKIT